MKTYFLLALIGLLFAAAHYEEPAVQDGLAKFKQALSLDSAAEAEQPNSLPTYSVKHEEPEQTATAIDTSTGFEVLPFQPTVETETLTVQPKLILLKRREDNP